MPIVNNDYHIRSASVVALFGVTVEAAAAAELTSLLSICQLRLVLHLQSLGLSLCLQQSVTGTVAAAAATVTVKTVKGNVQSLA